MQSCSLNSGLAVTTFLFPFSTSLGLLEPTEVTENFSYDFEIGFECMQAGHWLHRSAKL